MVYLAFSSHVLKREIKKTSLMVFENQFTKIHIGLVDDWSQHYFEHLQGLNRAPSEQNVSSLAEVRDIFYC